MTALGGFGEGLLRCGRILSAMEGVERWVEAGVEVWRWWLPYSFACWPTWAQKRSRVDARFTSIVKPVG